MEFAAAIWVQKHGSNTPDWVVWGLFALGAVPAFIALVRYERFLRAGGKIKEQIKHYPFSSALLCLIFLMVSCSTITTLAKHSHRQDSVSSKSPNQKAQSADIPAPAQSQAIPTLPIPAISTKPQHPSLQPQSPTRKGLVAPTNGTKTINPGGTVVGANAHADPSSVAIGSGAGQQPNPAPSLNCIDGSNCFTDNHGTVIGKLGYVLPPDRVISSDNWGLAKAKLEMAPVGSKVRFAVIGQTPEITVFSGQVIDLFQRAGWHVVFVDRHSGGNGLVNGVEQSSAEVHCQIDARILDNHVDGIVQEAMSIAGYPCKPGRASYAPLVGTMIHGKEYDNANIREIPNIYISIGTRIVPPQ